MADQGHISPAAPDRGLSGAGGSASDDRLVDQLQQVLTATHQLFSASGAGFMMLDDSSMLSSVAATDEPGRVLEECQQQTGHGPCVEAVTLDRITVTSDLAGDDRWPQLLPTVPDAGVRAILGIPIRTNGVAVGALNVYRDRPHDWTQGEVDALASYGTLIEGILQTALQSRNHELLAQQLQKALDNRVLIERAVGIVMGRDRVDAVTAFNQLRHLARGSQRKVADVAAALVDEVSSGTGG